MSISASKIVSHDEQLHFGLGLHLHSYFVYASMGGSGQSAYMV